MNSGIIVLILAFVLVCSFSFADIGPSPSFSFSVEQEGVPAKHSLYYAGNIWPEKLELVTEETQVYKLNTHIQVYAVPDEFAEDGMLKGQFKEITAASIVSQQISLSSGHTLFEIKSVNGQAMQLETKTSSPDISTPDYTFVIGAIVLVAIGIVVFFVAKRKK